VATLTVTPPDARFRPDAVGSLGLARVAPLAGSCAHIDPMGLVWSQVPDTPALDWADRDVFAQPPTAPLVTEVSLRRGDVVLAAQTLTQRLAAAGVTRHEVREDGLVGTLYLPAGAGPHPAVMVLNGSGGGINERRAALYASHGYATLALGYFKAPRLSAYISNTRLEYFEAVVAYEPGAVVHSAQNACDPALGREGPAWLWRGQPLPHLWQGNRCASWAPWDEGPEPRRHANALLTALRDADAVARARIPVEKIRGPVLLLSGSDDGAWPSSLYGRMVADKLAAVGHPYPVEHLDFDGAGHSIVFPYVPTTQLAYVHPVSGLRSTSGGAPAPNAQADEASWNAVKRFLQQAVAHRVAERSGTAGSSG